MKSDGECQKVLGTKISSKLLLTRPHNIITGWSSLLVAWSIICVLLICWENETTNQITNAPANGMDTRAQFNYNITDFAAALVTCTFHLDRKWRFSLFFIELALASFEFIGFNVIAIKFLFLRFVLVFHFQSTNCLSLHTVGIHSNIPMYL